jgi:hypothetical protein
MLLHPHNRRPGFPLAPYPNLLFEILKDPGALLYGTQHTQAARPHGKEF